MENMRHITEHTESRISAHMNEEVIALVKLRENKSLNEI